MCLCVYVQHVYILSTSGWCHYMPLYIYTYIYIWMYNTHTYQQSHSPNVPEPPGDPREGSTHDGSATKSGNATLYIDSLGHQHKCFPPGIHQHWCAKLPTMKCRWCSEWETKTRFFHMFFWKHILLLLSWLLLLLLLLSSSSLLLLYIYWLSPS